jgi:sugar lactone lactonase YvrE
MLSLDRAHVFYEGLDHPEGVAVHPDGSVWTGGEAGQLYRIEPDGSRVEEVARTGGFMLGLAFTPAADALIACDNGRKRLWRLDVATGALEEFAGSAAGRDLRIPNMVAFTRGGDLFVTDSGGFREVSGCVYRFRAEGPSELWHAGPFPFANGCALAPDESALYVVCSWGPGVERIEINADGSAGARSTAVTLPQTVPDGVAFDADGALYVSCYTPARIYRVAPGGAPEVFVDDWEAHTLANPTNIAWGGPAFDQLFSANLGRWHVTRIDAGVRGAPLACHAA